MKQTFSIFTALTIAAVSFLKIQAQTPVVFLMDAQQLVNVKQQIKQQDKATLQLVSSLQKKADQLLGMKAGSVMDKAFTPASGNKHDYMSQAPYFWYDSSKPNGLPYMRRDGVRNPEITKITDRKLLGELDNASRILALAWYVTGNEKYAAKASTLIHTWFFDTATRMNPNLDFGQAIPGVNSGRGIGIIETISLMGIADAAGLLQGSSAWTSKDNKALQAWYAQYLNWLLTSLNGNEEHAAKNNHGTWFYAQAVDFALFSGNRDKAVQLIEESKKLLEGQIDKEGKMPLELERTNGLGYSTYNLQAWFNLARLSALTGGDLWHYTNKTGTGIQQAFDWFLPYALGDKKWTYQQIGEYNKGDLYTLLLQAADTFKSPVYLETAARLEKEEGNNPVTGLLYKKH